MTASFDNDQPTDEDWEISIESGVIASALASNPEFIKAVADLILTALLGNKARQVGNLFDKWAQKATPLGIVPQAPGTKRLT